MKRIVALVLSVLFLVSGLYAETINSIRFEGLKKTKEDFMQERLKEFLGKEAEELNLKQVETVLQAEGLFSEIEVSVEGSELVVTVEEKITFIPLPFAMYSSDSGFMGGFMLLNMNVFGKKRMLVTGGIFSAEKQTGMLIYSKPAGDIHHPGYSIYSSLGHCDGEVTDFEDNSYFDVEMFNARAKFSINENINKYVSFSTGISYWYQNFFTDSITDNHEVLVSSSIDVNHVNWNGYYLITNSAAVSAEVGYSNVDQTMVERIGFRGMTQYAFVPMVRGILTCACDLQTGKFILNKADCSDVASTIMFTDFKTDQLFGSGIALEEALCKTKFGTVSLFETYEFDMAKDIFDDSFVYCHGPGAGVKLYIKQLAFPAMNIGFSYNVTQNDWKFVASFGMSM